MIEIYTDGSCDNGMTKLGGWAFCYYSEDNILIQSSGKESNTTNNRMEIFGPLAALTSLPNDSIVKIYSDSQYVVNTMTIGWKRNKNQDLWSLLDKEVARMKKVEFSWVRGHDGNELNEVCDKLASYKR